MAEPITTAAVLASIGVVKAYLIAHGVHIASGALAQLVVQLILNGPEKAVQAGVAGGVSAETAEHATKLLEGFDFSSLFS